MPDNLREKILGYIRLHRQARANDLARHLLFGRSSIHRQLKRLIEEGKLQKTGKPPVVFYTLVQTKTVLSSVEIPAEAKKNLEKEYLYINPQGKLLMGIDGFIAWAVNTHQEKQISNLAKSYVKIRQDFNHYRLKQGWIEATFKIKETFREAGLDKLLYADFYSLPQFGKTKLGSMMLYAKQSQNRELMQAIYTEVKPLVEKIIAFFKIEAVAYLPPSLPRNLQLMTELAAGFNLSLPQIKLIKTKTGDVIVAQKTLEKLEERIINARGTIFIKETSFPFKKILLIDDAVGSGASLNETAKKLKDLLPAGGKIIGFALAGSFKGFEVLREV